MFVYSPPLNTIGTEVSSVRLQQNNSLKSQLQKNTHFEIFLSLQYPIYQSIVFTGMNVISSKIESILQQISQDLDTLQQQVQSIESSSNTQWTNTNASQSPTQQIPFDARRVTLLESQVIASFAALTTAMSALEDLYSREISIPVKMAIQERLALLRNRGSQLRQMHASLKHQVARAKQIAERQALLSSMASANSSSMSLGQQQHLLRSQNGQQGQDLERIIGQTDHLINLGKFAFGDLQSQRNVLKSIDRRLVATLNHFKLSKHTMRMIRRRLRQNKLMFVVGSLVVIIMVVWLIKRNLFT